MDQPRFNWGLMRFLALAAVAALSLSAAATAATVTYNFTGVLTQGYQRGPAGAILDTELGRPTTFDATFVFDTSTPDILGNLPNEGDFLGKNAIIKVDGQTLFTGGTVIMGLNGPVANSNYGPESVVIQAYKPTTGGAGAEAYTFQAILGLPLNSLNGDLLPTATNAFDTRINGLGALALQTVAAGPAGPSSSAVRLTGYSFNQVMTATVTVTPAPEPGEWAMMAGGLGIVGAVARRRRKG